MWLVQDKQNQATREPHDGALDVDVVYSPFFNALPIRRTGLHQRTESLSLPVVYVRIPELTVETVVVDYASNGPNAGIELKSPVAETTITVDDEGFIRDYPGLAERI